jgi:hypothetical protein
VNSARVQTWHDYWQILWRRQWPHSGRICERIRSGPRDSTEHVEFLALDFRNENGDFGFGDETLELGSQFLP